MTYWTISKRYVWSGRWKFRRGKFSRITYHIQKLRRQKYRRQKFRSSDQNQQRSRNDIILIIIFRPYFIWERKIFKSNGFFFLQNLPRIIVYVIWRSTFTEFNWHKFSSMRYVFVKIFGLFWEWRKWPHNDPKMTPKMTKIQNFPNFHRFHAFFCHFFDKHRRLECWKRSTRHEFVVQ